MKVLPQKARFASTLLAGVILVAGILFWILSPDPREIFTRQMEDLAAKASEGAHLQLAPWFAPSFESWLVSRYQLSLTAALQQAAIWDRREKRLYRFKALPIFIDRQHAAAIFERSAPYGRFDRQTAVAVVPFAWEDGRWVIKETNPDGTPWVTNLRY